ncbi:MAG: hypothetical protein ACYDEO_15975, partial [Aggregatilineales bacterium]
RFWSLSLIHPSAKFDLVFAPQQTKTNSAFILSYTMKKPRSKTPCRLHSLGSTFGWLYSVR